jgi:hypothetical protein
VCSDFACVCAGAVTSRVFVRQTISREQFSGDSVPRTIKPQRHRKRVQ